MLASVSALAVSGAVIKRCACWEGYKPEIIQGALQCQGVQVEHTMGCDVLPPPRCACTGHNGILKDRSGTWCTIYLQGVEVKRWRCENRSEWDHFFNKLQHQQDLEDQKRPKPRP